MYMTVSPYKTDKNGETVLELHQVMPFGKLKKETDFHVQGVSNTLTLSDSDSVYL